MHTTYWRRHLFCAKKSVTRKTSKVGRTLFSPTLQVSASQDESVFEAAAATVQYKVDKGGTPIRHRAGDIVEMVWVYVNSIIFQSWSQSKGKGKVVRVQGKRHKSPSRIRLGLTLCTQGGSRPVNQSVIVSAPCI